MDTPHEDIFAANSSCIMTPDNIIGPYFVAGEQIRSNIVEGHPGVPLHLDIQFIDVNTCRPAKDLLIDIWHCNATGVYSGVSAAGQAGLKTTFLRGAQMTDADGVVEFDTIFPGHYQGRATHQHVSAHAGARLLPNNTYAGGTVNHISQLFFDQSLVTAVEATAQYNTNRVARTANNVDTYTGYSATTAYDPFPEYVLLGGNDLSKGIFMWLEIAINPGANYDDYAQIAAFLGPDGGTNNGRFNILKAITAPPTHG
jgi:protocatechuate 3,4-dioxygenase beta subunit